MVEVAATLCRAVLPVFVPCLAAACALRAFSGLLDG